MSYSGKFMTHVITFLSRFPCSWMEYTTRFPYSDEQTVHFKVVKHGS